MLYILHRGITDTCKNDNGESCGEDERLSLWRKTSTLSQTSSVQTFPLVTIPTILTQTFPSVTIPTALTSTISFSVRPSQKFSGFCADEINRTADSFFGTNLCSNLVSGHLAIPADNTLHELSRIFNKLFLYLNISSCESRDQAEIMTANKVARYSQHFRQRDQPPQVLHLQQTARRQCKLIRFLRLLPARSVLVQQLLETPAVLPALPSPGYLREALQEL
jgi:hypothetical protein